jgi:LacI family transcriptional regulator
MSREQYDGSHDENAAPAPSQRAVRVADIAREAGVSAATVDRVLNLRRGARPATVRLVLDAALRLDYPLRPEQRHYLLAPQPPMRIDFLLPAGNNRFVRMLKDYVGIVQEQMTPFNVHCHCHAIEGFNPSALAQALLRVGKQSNGIAFIALEHPIVRETVNTLAERNVPTITLASDLSNSRRLAYIGVDNRAAGRTAGLLLGRFIGKRKGKLGMIAGSLSYRGHEEREMGFMHIVREMLPEMEVLGVREGLDDSERNYLQTRALLKQHPDLLGIYNIGAGSDGIAQALKEARLDQKVAFVGHELTPDTRALLIDGTLDAVLNQNSQIEVMDTVRTFINWRDGKPPLAGIEPMRIGVFLSENLP